jgi:hypothetical protein
VSDDGKIKRLPVRFKQPPAEDGVELKIVHAVTRGECNHAWRVEGLTTVNASYLLREGETEVECSLCSTRLDPMWVLRKLATEESNWHRTRQRYQEEMARLKERTRTKCRSCGAMTPISRS